MHKMFKKNGITEKLDMILNTVMRMKGGGGSGQGRRRQGEYVLPSQVQTVDSFRQMRINYVHSAGRDYTPDYISFRKFSVTIHGNPF